MGKAFKEEVYVIFECQNNNISKHLLIKKNIHMNMKRERKHYNIIQVESSISNKIAKTNSRRHQNC